ncbi:hypothetical protein Emed_004429 [Eimeria media]
MAMQDRATTAGKEPTASGVVAESRVEGGAVSGSLSEEDASRVKLELNESGTQGHKFGAHAESVVKLPGTGQVGGSAAQQSGNDGRVSTRMKPRQVLSKPTMPWPPRPVSSNHGAVTREAEVLDASLKGLPETLPLSTTPDETGLASMKSFGAPPLKVKVSTPYRLRDVEQWSTSAKSDELEELDLPVDQSMGSHGRKHATRSPWPQAESAFASAGRPPRVRPVSRKEGATTEHEAKTTPMVQRGGKPGSHEEATRNEEENLHQNGVLLDSQDSRGSKLIVDEVLPPDSASLQAHARLPPVDAPKAGFEAGGMTRSFGYDSLHGVKTYTAGSKTMRRKAAPSRGLSAQLTMNLNEGAGPLRLGSGPALAQAARLPSLPSDRALLETPKEPTLEHVRKQLVAEDAEARVNVITPTNTAGESKPDGRPSKVLQADVREGHSAAVAPAKGTLREMSLGAPKLRPQPPPLSSRMNGVLDFGRPLTETQPVGSLSTKPSDEEDAVPGADRSFDAQESKKVLKLQAAWRGHETRTWIQAAEIVRGMQWAREPRVAKLTKPHTNLSRAGGSKPVKKDFKGDGQKGISTLRDFDKPQASGEGVPQAPHHPTSTSTGLALLRQDEMRNSQSPSTQANRRRSGKREVIPAFGVPISPRLPSPAAAPVEVEKGGQNTSSKETALRDPPAGAQAGYLESSREMLKATEQPLKAARLSSGPGLGTRTSPKKPGLPTARKTVLLKDNSALQSTPPNVARPVTTARQDSPKSQLSMSAKDSAVQATGQEAQVVASVSKDNEQESKGDRAVVVREEPQEPPHDDSKQEGLSHQPSHDGSKLLVVNPKTESEGAAEAGPPSEVQGGSSDVEAVPASSSSPEEASQAAGRDSPSRGSPAQEEAEASSHAPAGDLKEEAPLEPAIEGSASVAHDSPDVAVQPPHALESAARRRHHAPSAYALAPVVSRTKPLVKKVDTGRAAEEASVEEEEPSSPEAASPRPRRNSSKLGRGLTAAIQRAYSLFGRDSNAKQPPSPKEEQLSEPHAAAGWIRDHSYAAGTPDPIDASQEAAELEEAHEKHEGTEAHRPSLLNAWPWWGASSTPVGVKQEAPPVRERASSLDATERAALRSEAARWGGRGIDADAHDPRTTPAAPTVNPYRRSHHTEAFTTPQLEHVHKKR